MNTAYLILENGTVFMGQAFGHQAETVGELVFSTAMVGYLETLTDPGYYGQMVLQTFPLIGNYGVISSDLQSETVQIKAYIVKEWCQEPSNFRSEGELDAFLRHHQIPGLCGIDTRALTHIIRENGVQNAMISTTPTLTDEQWQALRSYKITGGVDALGAKDTYRVDNSDAKYNVVFWDFGASGDMIQELVRRGCAVTVVGPAATADDIAAINPDGILLGNGPGDPAENTRIIAELAKLRAKNIPTAGVCLGHQLLALSRGAKTEKLPFGHRGANQPVLEAASGKVFVTSQNHGYAVTPGSLPASAEMSHVNCNDKTCEGIRYKDEAAFSVQFYPESEDGGPGGKQFYNEFVAMLERGAK